MTVANTARSSAASATDQTSDLLGSRSAYDAALAASVQDRTLLHQQVDAQASSLSTLSGQVAGLASTIASLASATSVQSVQQSLTALAGTVSGLAGSLSALTSSVAGKASQSALDALISRVTAAELTLASRASQATLDALITRVAAVEAFGARITALESRPVVTLRTGSASLPAIALLQSKDVVVTWSAPLPSASYSVVPSIGGYTPDQYRIVPKSQTTTTCTVTVTAVLAIAGGANLSLVAEHAT